MEMDSENLGEDEIQNILPRRRFDGENPETFSEIDRAMKRIRATFVRCKRTAVRSRRRKKLNSAECQPKQKTVRTSMGIILNKIEWKDLEKETKKKPNSPKLEQRERLLPFYDGGPYNKPKVSAKKEEEEGCQFYDHMNIPGCSYPRGNADHFPCFITEDDEQDWQPTQAEQYFRLRNTIRYGTADGSMPTRFKVIDEDYYKNMDPDPAWESAEEMLPETSASIFESEKIEETVGDVEKVVAGSEDVHKENNLEIAPQKAKKNSKSKLKKNKRKAPFKWPKLSKIFPDGIPQMDFHLPDYIYTDSGLEVPGLKKLKEKNESIQPKKPKKVQRKRKGKKRKTQKKKKQPVPEISRPPIKLTIKRSRLSQVSSLPEQEEEEVTPKIGEVMEFEKEEEIEPVPFVEEIENSPETTNITPEEENSNILQPISRKTSEELATELHQTYADIPNGAVQSFHTMLLTHLNNLKEIFLGNEAEAAAASVALPKEAEEDSGLLNMGISSPVEEFIISGMEYEDESVEIQSKYNRVASPQGEIEEIAGLSPEGMDEFILPGSSPLPSSSTPLATNNMTDEDLEEFAEFFPDLPKQLRASTETPQRETMDEVEKPSCSWSAEKEATVLRNRICRYSDSEPSTSHCSRESSAEMSEKTPEMAAEQETPLLLQPFSSEDEIFAAFPYTAPTTETNLMPSPIASQQ